MKAKSTSISRIKKDNARVIKFLKKAATQEPKSGKYAWMSGNSNNMRDVVTFRTEGKAKGSLERFKEANKIPKAVYDAMREAAAYGAHSTQGSSKGILAFEITPKNLKKLETKLNKIYIARDKNNNGKIDAGKEEASVKKTKNGAALLKAATKLRSTKLTGLRTEHKFSRQVNYLVDQMYSKGSIQGPKHIDKVVADLPAKEGAAVRAAYASVSRYMTKGQTSKKDFICRDQRREVTRGLMRTFGASLDKTEKAISGLKLPSGY